MNVGEVLVYFTVGFSVYALGLLGMVGFWYFIFKDHKSIVLKIPKTFIIILLIGLAVLAFIMGSIDLGHDIVTSLFGVP